MSNLNSSDNSRRDFISKSVKIAALSGFTSLLVAGCKEEGEEEEAQKVSPPEDLMQEHGIIGGRQVFIKGIRRVQVIGTKQFRLGLKKFLTNFCKQRVFRIKYVRIGKAIGPVGGL